MDANAIIKKLFQHFKIKRLNKLAEILGITPAALSTYKHRNTPHSIFKACIKKGIYSEVFEPIEKPKNILDDIELLRNPEVIRLLTVVNTVINGNDENLENFKGNIKNWIQESIWTD